METVFWFVVLAGLVVVASLSYYRRYHLPRKWETEDEVRRKRENLEVKAYGKIPYAEEVIAQQGFYRPMMLVRR